MNKHKIGLILSSLVFVGCGLFNDYPDRRNARIVVRDPELVTHAQLAIRWWNTATGEVSSEIADHCDPDHTCVRMRFEKLSPKIGGDNLNWENIITAENGSRIRINPMHRDDPETLRHVVAHEIGHSMGLHHTAGNDSDLMHPNGSVWSCIDQESIDEWVRRYGNSNDYRVVCSFELE